MLNISQLPHLFEFFTPTRVCVTHIPMQFILNCPNYRSRQREDFWNCPEKKLHFLLVKWKIFCKLEHHMNLLNWLRDIPGASLLLPGEPFFSVWCSGEIPQLALLLKWGHLLPS
jgi:hypothetical protein